MGELLKQRLAEARERHRVRNLITDLRSGNVVTADTLRMAEALATISEGNLTAEEMAEVATDALLETG